MIEKFYNKLTKNILNSLSFVSIKEYIDNNINEAEELMFSLSSVEDLFNIDITENTLLSKLFDYTSDGRGDNRGKGELLIVFLIEDATFNTDSDLRINGKNYEVKSYQKDNEGITFGVENVVSLHDFGIKLLMLFYKIKTKGENDSTFVETNNDFWFNTKNGGNWKGEWRIKKFLGNEVPKTQFNKLFTEIPALKGIIEDEYVNDISKLRSDIDVFNAQFNENHLKNEVLLFVKSNLHSIGATYKASLFTQGKVKMVLV